MMKKTKLRKMPRKGASIKPQASALTCPRCKSKEVVYEGVDVSPSDSYNLYERALCNACGFKWVDHYERVRQIVGWG